LFSSLGLLYLAGLLPGFLLVMLVVACNVRGHAGGAMSTDTTAPSLTGAA
jgi:hypothetical protein